MRFLFLFLLTTLTYACGAFADIPATSDTANTAAASANVPVAADSNQSGGGQTTVSSPNTVSAVVCPVGQQPNGNIGGPSICCSGNYKVCDDFEAQAVGGQPNKKLWQVEAVSDGTYGLKNASQTIAASSVDQNVLIEISSAKAARGKQSLHIVATNSNQLAHGGWHSDMVVNRTIFPAPNNTFWGRAFIYYVSDANSAVANGHCTYANASGNVPVSSPFYTWWRISTFGNLALNCEHGDAGADPNPAVALPVNRWACMEWEYRGDANNEVHLYLDGNHLVNTTKTTETADNPGGLAPVYDAFRFGFETYGYQYNPAPKQFEMYYDEVALDYNRIGCAM